MTNYARMNGPGDAPVPEPEPNWLICPQCEGHKHIRDPETGVIVDCPTCDGKGGDYDWDSMRPGK